jgi:hypothetical protein
MFVGVETTNVQMTALNLDTKEAGLLISSVSDKFFLHLSAYL